MYKFYRCDDNAKKLASVLVLLTETTKQKHDYF